jgi:hypothetical protein
MCLTCGCLLSHEDHGNPEYLTIEAWRRVLSDMATAVKRLQIGSRGSRLTGQTNV